MPVPKVLNFQEFIENLFDSAYFVDVDRKITYWNPAAEKLTGFSRNEVVGSSCADRILTHVDEHGVSLCERACPLAHTIHDGKPRQNELFLHHKNGSRIPVSIRIAPIRDNSGQIIGAIELFTDERFKQDILQQIEELKRLSLIDPLTLLGNRRYIEMALQSRMADWQRDRILFGVMFLDIDNFKLINDRYGHHIGDCILKMVAQTVLNNARVSDAFGRWGGEEIVGWIRVPDHRQFYHLAERFRLLIENSYLTVENQVVSVTVSIGATFVTPDDNVETLISRADQLMYQSKKKGKNCITMDDMDGCTEHQFLDESSV